MDEIKELKHIIAQQERKIKELESTRKHMIREKSMLLKVYFEVIKKLKK